MTSAYILSDLTLLYATFLDSYFTLDVIYACSKDMLIYDEVLHIVQDLEKASEERHTLASFYSLVCVVVTIVVLTIVNGAIFLGMHFT